MRWIQLCALTLCLALLAQAPQARAQSQSPPCTPPPGTASAITCFGNTPCPAGYIDPVGLAQRNLRQNFADPSDTRWLCEQDPSAQGGNVVDENATSLPPPAQNAAPPVAPAAVIPVITTTLGLSSTTPPGPFLTDNQGMTLYVRTSDSTGVSTCYNSCALIWPAATAPAGDLTLPNGANGALATLNRTDGTKQLSYNGMPLYRYTGDIQPGDANGNGLDATTAQGVSGVWKVAAP